MPRQICCMKKIFLLSLLLISCSERKGEREKTDSTKVSKTKRAEVAQDTTTFLRSVPKSFVVYDSIQSDTSIVVFKDKCVVFANYSHQELAEMEKKMGPDNWEGFYDDMAYYGNNASLFLTERTITERVYEEKYLRFVFASGKTLTIDRHKAAESIFFFNPDKGIKYCHTHWFNKEKYSGY